MTEKQSILDESRFVLGLDVVAELNLTLYAAELYSKLYADRVSTFQYRITRLHAAAEADKNPSPIEILLQQSL